MALRRYTLYDGAGAVLEDRTVEEPDSAEAVARQAFRDAVSGATTLAALKDALLGTNTGAEADVRPTR